MTMRLSLEQRCPCSTFRALCTADTAALVVLCTLLVSGCGWFAPPRPMTDEELEWASKHPYVLSSSNKTLEAVEQAAKRHDYNTATKVLRDIPVDFLVLLLDDSGNDSGFYVAGPVPEVIEPFLARSERVSGILTKHARELGQQGQLRQAHETLRTVRVFGCCVMEGRAYASRPMEEPRFFLSGYNIWERATSAEISLLLRSGRRREALRERAHLEAGRRVARAHILSVLHHTVAVYRRAADSPPVVDISLADQAARETHAVLAKWLPVFCKKAGVPAETP